MKKTFVCKKIIFTPGTPLQISMDGTRLTISPLRNSADAEKFRKALGKVNKRFGRTFRKLARRSTL